MPAIQFDVLIPDAPALQLQGVFEEAISKLIAAEKLTGGAVTHDHTPKLHEGIEEGLREDRDDLYQAQIHRYVIAVEGATGSVNQLAMVLSRFLTPQADLPTNAVALENEQAHEVPAIYPWAVEIRR
ncbi:hypothetical protein EAH68_10230 [Corynebacterium hylobatis]|uniref:Uncharacterized protein n=1 Tax=Corynebacterium hylobatis TaxID=1859290 RepID=A0A430HX72_9CORY|nr:hypothetical protein [Corynebacterium hylobatis]RSZ62084.1 hypothetical protein EAH68_10230 [Corynebacterium hylobatis]